MEHMAELAKRLVEASIKFTFYASFGDIQIENEQVLHLIRHHEPFVVYNIWRNRPDCNASIHAGSIDGVIRYLKSMDL